MPTLGNTPRPAYVYDTETDTWVPVGVGAHTHSDIPNTLVDAKGDLITATADNVPARLAKGADGTVLVSDSTTSTGLAWQPYGAIQSAGKNKIINGDMNVWQRGVSFLGAASNSFVGYTADRWYANIAEVTRQSFTLGELPAAEGSQYFLKSFNKTGMGSGAFDRMDYRIEDVRTLAGQTVTLSFYTRKPTAKNGILGGAIVQNFGSGGSASVTAIGISAPSYSGTSWVRSTTTFTMPSLAGKTIGANNYIEIQLYGNMGGAPNFEYDIWGVQLEAGPIATPFTTATGTIQGELAACQRYYESQIGNMGFVGSVGNGIAYYAFGRFQVQKRTGSSNIVITTTSVSGFPSSNAIAEQINISGFRTYLISNAATSNGFYINNWTADCEL